MTFTSLKLSLFAVALACLVPAPALLANNLPQGDAKQKQMQMPKDQVAPAEKRSLREDPSNPVALIKTNYGDIYVELFSKEAPKTVKNFLELANGQKEFTEARPVTTPKDGEDQSDASKPQKVKRPFYDGLTFHRVIQSFMIQGGCPLGNGTGGPGYKFEDEISATALGLDKLKAFQDEGQGTGQNTRKPGGPHPWLMIRSRRDFQQKLLMPILRKLKINNQKELQEHLEEIKTRLDALTLKEAFENMGYQYDDARGSHKPVRGSMAMANSGPNTNGSQFFINLVDTPHLTGKHTVFGKVIEGMDVVDKIGGVSVDLASKPAKPVTILSIRKVDYTEHPEPKSSDR